MNDKIRNPNQEIGEKLKLARRNLGVNLVSLCDALGNGCCCQELEDSEAGRIAISAARLAQCARLLDMPIEFFVQDEAMLDWNGDWRLLSLFRSLSKTSQTRMIELMVDISNDTAITDRH